MSTTNNGGPVFPSICESVNGVPMAKGLTAWDYFAAHADVSVYTPIETFERANGRKPTVGELAAYIAGIRDLEARAMLTAREVSASNDGWVAYGGGSCPVASDAYVQIKYASNDTDAGRAGNLRWGWLFGGKGGGDIVAYRIVTP